MVFPGEEIDSEEDTPSNSLVLPTLDKDRVVQDWNITANFSGLMYR